MRSLNALFCSQRLGMFNLVCHNGPRATGYLLSGAHRRHAESYAFRHERPRLMAFPRCGPDQDRGPPSGSLGVGNGGGTLSCFWKARTVPRSEARVSRLKHVSGVLCRCPTLLWLAIMILLPSGSSRAISNSDLAKFYVIRTFLPLCVLVTQTPSPQVWM
jgi:hypothetical protein